jgi:hypothetical protein
VGTPGFGNDLVETAGGPVPLSDIRLKNADPVPLLDIELGPAVQTAGGVKWEVRARRVVGSVDEFHRVAFGLLAPPGTTASQLHWIGCARADRQRHCAPAISPPAALLGALQGVTVNP